MQSHHRDRDMLWRASRHKMRDNSDCTAPKAPRAEIALLCFVLAVAAGVWLWGLLNLPIWAAVLLWWWPSVFAGALAGAVVAAGYEILRRLLGGTNPARRVTLSRSSERRSW